MIRIAICDDFPDVVTQLNEYLSEYQQLNDRQLDVKSFYNAEDLWEHLKENRCDLVILDIELVKMNGVELGQLVRSELNDHTMKIVYISAKDCYDRQLFDVQPLNFLPKPIDKEKLFKMIDLTIQLSNDTERFFVFENKQGSFRMRLDDILYFESFDHYFIVSIGMKYPYMTDWVYYVVLAAAALVVIVLSPVEDKNKPLDEIEHKVYKKRAIIIAAIELTVSILFKLIGMDGLFFAVVYSFAVLGFMLIVGRIKNHLNRHR